MARGTSENRERERKRRGPSLLGVLLGLALLAVAGFAVGMVSGVVFQNPGLAWAYFTGDTEEVSWAVPASAPAGGESPAQAAAEAAVDPQVRREFEAAAVVAAPETAVAAPGTAVAAAVPEATAPAAPPAPPAPVAAPPGGGLAVQVGAFGTSRAAENLAGLLRRKGFPVLVSPGTQAGESRWRVRVGPFASRDQAEATADRLKREDQLPTWILSEDAD